MQRGDGILFAMSLKGELAGLAVFWRWSRLSRDMEGDSLEFGPE